MIKKWLLCKNRIKKWLLNEDGFATFYTQSITVEPIEKQPQTKGTVSFFDKTVMAGLNSLQIT